ncbi:MAG: hypothetical protein GX610_01270 [Rhodococcus sp.]|nr:hypothetical protein [Rhodococcus sp. (in: high G+C Gram-positive bacteria)]
MIPGAPHIEQLAPSATVAHVCSALGLPLSTPKAPLAYETIRAIAWASTSGRTPVSTRTLLDRVMDVDTALQNGTVDEYTRRRTLRKYLDDLVAVGDLAELGRGQWVSTTGTIVCVDSAAGRTHLLVSGVPIRSFPSTVQRALTLDGPIRMIKRLDDVRILGLPVLSLNDWARIPNVPLDQWTSCMLEAPLADPDDSSATLRIYQPDSSRLHSRQEDRWSPFHQAHQGRYLARHNALGEWSGYAIVELRSGTVVGRRELDPLDVRRLMYGLDHRSGTSIIANVKTTHGSTTIQLRDPLPHPETRVLLALCGVPVRDTWTVRQNVEVALDQLRDLHINLRSRT